MIGGWNVEFLLTNGKELRGLSLHMKLTMASSRQLDMLILEENLGWQDTNEPKRTLLGSLKS